MATTKFLITVAATPTARDKAKPRVDSTPQPLTKQRQRPAAMRASAAGFRVPRLPRGCPCRCGCLHAPPLPLVLRTGRSAGIFLNSKRRRDLVRPCFAHVRVPPPIRPASCTRPDHPQDLSSMARRADLRPDPPCLRVPFGTVTSSAFGTTSRRVAAAREGGVRDRVARVIGESDKRRALLCVIGRVIGAIA